jgi:cobalamin biosynthesis protein CobC
MQYLKAHRKGNEMPSIAHGGRLSEARRLFPQAPEPWLDLSTGINPQPYPLPPLASESFTRLPDSEEVDLLQSAAAAAYHVADPAMIAAAPGTQILIELLPRLWPASSVAVLGPTYAEHARAWAKTGGRTHDVATVEELGNAAVAVLCNPNNPDGRRFSPDRLLALADELAARGGLLVVDEAFADLEGEELSLGSALPHPALIILRSFGKTYGLAGLRLGFALAEPDRAGRIRDALGPWAISGPAIAVGLQALTDRAWFTATAERLANATRELDACLSDSGLSVIGGTRLFRLIDAHDASGLFARLGHAGIFVRRFADHPTWLRFGQPGGTANMKRLKAALPG